MRTLSLLFAIVCTLSGYAQVGGKVQENKIQGTWHTNSLGDQMTLTLKADGSGDFDGEAITYIAKDNKFTMTIVAESETHVYKYILDGNSLTLSGGDLEAPIMFMRETSSVQKSPKK